jgi:sugar lactone lactonase YvrE
MNKMLLPLLALMLGSTQLPAQPVITNQPANQTVVWGGNATFSVTATGVGPFTYQWQLNGTNLPNNIITTVAGGNLFNNQPATNTILNSATGVAWDNVGNLFIAENGNHVIRKVATNGVATIVAGNGCRSFSGDGGAATNAGLSSPFAVTVDPSGNLLISDSGNNRIRKVDTNGIITTLAGIGSAYGGSGDNHAATNAALNQPFGLCLDNAGNLFIADSLNGSIRKVGINGIITTVVGQYVNTALLNPTGVATDSSNNLYIADRSHNRILKLTPIGNISTVAGTGTSGYSGDGGLAASATLNNPEGVAVDTARNLFIVDSGNNCVRKVGTNNIITTVAGTGNPGYSGDGGLATNANLSIPTSASVDSIGNLLIADDGNSRIRKVDASGIITTVAGRNLNDGDCATNATLNRPYGMVFDPAGNLYLADSLNSRIRKVDTNGIITTVAGNGIFASAGNGGAATNGSLKSPTGIALDAFGNMFIADYSDNRIRKVDTNGIISTLAGTGALGAYSGDGGPATNAVLPQPFGVAVDAAGNCFIAAPFVGCLVLKVDTNGVITRVAGKFIGFSGDGSAATNASLAYPYSLAFDSVGNLFIADSGNYRIRKVNTNGIISTVAGNGVPAYSGDGGPATSASIGSPYAVTVDPAGNIYIADFFNDRIRKVGTNGIITTVAGNGIQGFTGDGGTGNHAQLSCPNGLAVDGGGNVYFSDSGNNRIRKLAYVDYADQPSFTLTNVTLGSLSNNYSVIVTSASGSVTGSVATVNLQLPAITPALTQSDGVFAFTWGAVSNLTYQLQYTTNLVAPKWIDLGNPITATNGSASTTDAVGSDEQRFYRVRLLP